MNRDPFLNLNRSLNGSDEEMQSDKLERLIDECVPLVLSGSANERRQSAAKLRASIRDYMVACDAPGSQRSLTCLQEGISALISASTNFGIGDRQLREMMLLLLERLQEKPLLQVLFEFIPCMHHRADNNYTQQLITSIERKIEQNTDLTIPALKCLSNIPATAARSFQLALAISPTACNADLPDLLQVLLRQFSAEKNTNAVWTMLRALEIDTKTANVVVHQFLDNSLLAGSYIKFLEQENLAEQDKSCTRMDLFVLLSLSRENDFGDLVDRLFDSWISSQCFPFSLLRSFLDQLPAAPSELYDVLSPALIRLAVFLLLAPIRVIGSSGSTLQSVQKFVLSLHDKLTSRHQSELVQSLLHLSEESVNMGPLSRKRRRDDKRAESYALFCKSLDWVIRKLAEKSPNCVAGFQHILIRRLTHPLYDAAARSYARMDGSMQEICSILVSLLAADSKGSVDRPTLMNLLQKLLFSSTGTHGAKTATGDWAQVHRGLVLAKVMIASGMFAESDLEKVKNWALQIILPSTRRMVPADLGEASLDFLKVWRDSNDGKESKAVFKHFKMMLANTGLIQVLSHYKTSKENSKVLLGYKNIPPEVSQTNENSRNMLFCIHYFLRRNDLRHPERWGSAIRWVFQLVDTYLQMGRRSTKSSWKPEGWLQSAVEIFPLALVFSSLSSEHRYLLEMFTDQLNTFEIASAYAVKSCFAANDFAHVITEGVSCKDEAENMLHSVVQFEAALLLAISLSLAVVKNAYEHVRPVTSDEAGQNLLCLFQYQLAKLYDLESKSSSIKALLCALQQSMRGPRGQKKMRHSQGGASDGHRAASKTDYDDEGATIERIAGSASNALTCIEAQHVSLFSDSSLIHLEVLWACLEKPQDRHRLEAVLKGLPNSIESLTDMMSPSALRTVDLQCKIIRHLSCIISGTNHISVHQSSMLHVVRSLVPLFDSLPKVRLLLASCGQDQGQDGDPILSLAVAYTRLMFLILMRTSSTQAISEKWAYLSWCEDCPELLPWMKDDRGPSSRASALFEFFKSRLVSTDYNLIAYYMLEILSLLALHDNKRLLVDVPKLSWIALHTVYIDSHEQDDSSITSSFAQSHALQMLAARRSSSFVKTQRQVVESTIVKLSETTPFALKFVPYRQYLLRHWALITRSTGQLKLFSVHLVSLVDELRSIISIVDKAIKGRSRKTTSSATQNEESPPARPSLPFLDGTTFPDYFETLAVMIVGSVSVTEPAADGSAPYSHVKKLFQIFRHLMEVYRSGFQLFPRRATSFVFHLTRDMMTASIAQLHAASEWRSSQPLLSVTDRMAGAFDVGALSHFHDLVDSMASNVVGTAVALYEFCLEGDAGLQFPFQRTGMRSSVEKAELEVKDIARLHNLPPPSFRLESAEKSTGALEVAEPTAGFHNADTSEIETSLQGPDQSDHEDPEEMHKSALGGDSTDGEDSSFGVAGGWGGDGSDDDEDSSGSLDLQASTFLRST